MKQLRNCTYLKNSVLLFLTLSDKQRHTHSHIHTLTYTHMLRHTHKHTRTHTHDGSPLFTPALPLNSPRRIGRFSPCWVISLSPVIRCTL